MNKTLLALAASTALALSAGIAFAADPAPAAAPAATPAADTKAMGDMAAPAKAKGHKAAAKVEKLVPFVGKAKSFTAGSDNKSVTVANKAGDTFNLVLADECKSLADAKSVKLSQSKSGGWVWTSKTAHCKVTSFAKSDAAPAPAPSH